MKLRSVPQIAVQMKPVQHQVYNLGAIARSLTRLGYKVRETYDLNPPEAIVLCWAWGKAMDIRRTNPKAIICCMDHGHLPNRKQGVVNTGWSTHDMPIGLNGWGEHYVCDDGGARARELGWDKFLQPRRAPIDNSLVFMGQVFGDAAIRGSKVDYAQWCRDTIADLTKRGYKTRFRPHPVMVRRGTVAQYGNLGRISSEAGLYDALDMVSYCAALNSNAATEAFIYGIESTVYNGGSMLYPLVPEPGAWADWGRREKWFNMLCWTNWRLEELESGLWAEHNLPILHRLLEGGKAEPWEDVRIQT